VSHICLEEVSFSLCYLLVLLLPEFPICGERLNSSGLMLVGVLTFEGGKLQEATETVLL
jgi:hypothetical protein